jgi:hypothetical protein
MSPDQKGSEIFISADTPIEADEHVGQRPAITVLRSTAAFQGIGIGDRSYVDWRTGAHHKMDIIPTTLNINVLSRISLEAENLAWFVGSHIWILRESLVRGQSGLLYMGNRPTFSAPSPAGSLVTPDTEHNWVVVSVSFPVYLQHSMSALPLGDGLSSGIVEEIEATMTTLGSGPGSGSPENPEPTVPLQGSAVQQAEIVPPQTGLALPQTPEVEAQSTSQPLTVTVKVTEENP